MMTKRRCAYYRMLTVFMALYGVMQVCICSDHASSFAKKPVCCQGSSHVTRAAGVQLASHHQCCGMERAPVAIEQSSSSTLTAMTEYALLHPAALFSDADFHTIILSTFSHAPPGDIPIYFTTQRFVI